MGLFGLESRSSCCRLGLPAATFGTGLQDMHFSVTSTLPYFLTSALLLALGWSIVRSNSFYGKLLEAEDASPRFHAVDGLRGFLALAVFFHHAVVSYFYYKTGHWAFPPARFYVLLGEVGVALFFMITGFLFWNKGLREGVHLRSQAMLWSRLCRLAPMYLCSVGFVFAVAIALTDFELRQAPIKFVGQVLSWGSFGFLEAQPINGFGESWLINAGVQWSLSYEWMFYLFLPLGLIFARGWGFVLLSAFVAAYIYKFSVRGVEWNFLFGALAALVVAREGLLPDAFWRGRFVGLFALGVLGVLFAGFERGYGFTQSVLLVCFFICVAKGNDLAGLLSSRAARFLGAISYSVYLVHGIVLFVILRAVNRHVPIAAMTPEGYWLLVALCGAVLVGICALTYRIVEHPCMKLPGPGWGPQGAPVAAPCAQPRGATIRMGE